MNALEALAEPTRRRIVELLADGERSAGEIASHFETSRPGISRSTRNKAQKRLYSLDPAPLADLDAWLERYRGFWTNRLDALDTEIRRQQRQRKET